MKLVQIQFSPWDRAYNFDPGELSLKKGDKVVVKTDLGLEIGEVIDFVETEVKEKEDGTKEIVICKKNCENCQNEEKTKEVKSILRIAGPSDFKKKVNEEERSKALDICKKAVKKLELPMKIVDAFFSYDGTRLTFAFIADGRIDFRELVKELTRTFGKTIRLQQIGIRDEAKLIGDFGHCGLPLCCKGFLKDLNSITSEMAEVQQCAHRGSERLSGICGRLMCCLAYEEKGYADLQKNMPPIGMKVNVDGKRGVVVGHHVLKQSVDVEFPSEKESEQPTRMEVDLNRNKKK